ncbi:MAG: ATPase [Alphaproteobacteria bacterium]|nr:ATPase [Alphaproteobacteria bacterium]
MKFASGQEFKEQTHYVISLMAMSGMGKTYLGQKLLQEEWFHYSADYRIGTRYLVEDILDALKIRMMQDPILRTLLRSDSIYLAHNLTVDNLELLSNFIGKFGDKKKGGFAAHEFLRRQQLYADAEIRSQSDIAPFISKARDIYGYHHFLNDTTGSLCEIADIDNIDTCPIMQNICAHSVLIYVEADADDEKMIIERQLAYPKPMYYNRALFDEIRAEYGDNIEPDDFLRYIFPRTIEFRKQRYQKLARHYGYIISGKDFRDVKNSHDFVDLIADNINNSNDV